MSDSETSGVEDSDDEEIFNLSQTNLFHKIKTKHNVDIKTKVKKSMYLSLEWILVFQGQKLLSIGFSIGWLAI